MFECLHVRVVSGPHVYNSVYLTIAEGGEGLRDRIDGLVHENQRELSKFGYSKHELPLLPS